MGHLTQSTLILGVLTAFLAVSFCDDDPIMNEFAHKCAVAGTFPHPDTKHKFYECVEHPNEPNKFMSLTYNCPDKQCFDSFTPPKCSLAGCCNNGNGTDYMCLRAHMREDAQKNCEDEMLRVLKNDTPKMINFTAFRGDPFNNMKLSLRDVNADMKNTYTKRIESTGKNVFPLMIATDGEPDYVGVGTSWKVFLRNGTMWRINPVRPTYEIFKCLGHIVRGVFAIVSPYFHSPNSINWIPELKYFADTLENVNYLLKNEKLGLSDSETKLALNLLKETLDYINLAITAKSASMDKFVKYAHDLTDDIEAAMELAARYQAEDTIPALLELREKMGHEEFSKLYVIIPNVWPVSQYNVRLQALARVMTFDQIKSQVLMIEGAQNDDQAKATLGRILFDRTAAQLIWGGMDEETMKDHVFSLSTKRDLVSTAAGIEQNIVCKKMKEDPNKLHCPTVGIGYAGRLKGRGLGEEFQEMMLPTMLR